MNNNVNNNQVNKKDNFDNVDNFDWKTYINNYKDLQDAGINTKESAWGHWITYGQKENRIYHKKIKNEIILYKKYIKINKIENKMDNKIDDKMDDKMDDNFDWKTYINNYKDLQDAGINTKKLAWKHWITFGQKENRIFHLEKQINYFNSEYYYDKIKEFINIYKYTEQEIINNDKNGFRYFCYKFLNYIRQIDLPLINFNNKYETVLIEYRCFPHLEFLIRNMILKLGSNWSYTIVCGNLNYEFIINMCKNISNNIKIIKTDYDNLNQSTYSKLLASVNFWNLFYGDKILIYQEDSCIFKTNINDFLEYDYIGAPWSKNQNDNELNVGNGGFSLRTKQIMIDIINKIKIEDTKFNTSTLEYMKNCNLIIGPEDVYFSLNMIKYNIGKVASWDIANKFSIETQYNDNSLGGHNFWLCDKNWKEHIFDKIFNNKICLISSPYGLGIGGGEINLLNFSKYFITQKKCKIYLCINENNLIKYNTIKNVLGIDYIPFFNFFSYNEITFFNKKVDYHFDMNNLKNPNNIGCAKEYFNNLYHCQFPFDTNELITNNNINTYGNIILNSDYTKYYYELYTTKYLQKNQKLSIIYPACIYENNLLNEEKILNIINNKDKKSFIMLGRICDNYNNAHNKGYDVALKYFEIINNMGYTDFDVNIIGTVYSQNMLNKLKSYNIKNLNFFLNCDDETKYKILEKSKYIINITGINRNKITESYSYEHFGISIIEGINYGCIPISIDGGYPPYYINENTGIIFSSENDFLCIIKEIIINNKPYKFDDIYYKKLLNNFTEFNFYKKINEII